MAFRTMEEVIAEAKQRENPELYFRDGMAQKTWSDNISRTLVDEWLQRNDRHKAEVASQAAHAVAERTASATEAATKAAQKSARWAGWAVGISVVALGVSALPLILR